MMQSQGAFQARSYLKGEVHLIAQYKGRRSLEWMCLYELGTIHDLDPNDFTA